MPPPLVRPPLSPTLYIMPRDHDFSKNDLGFLVVMVVDWRLRAQQSVPGKLFGHIESVLKILRASPPIPPNGNGGRAMIAGPGQLAGTGWVRVASGPGQDAANATHGALWRGDLTPPPSIRLVICCSSPSTFFPSTPMRTKL